MVGGVPEMWRHCFSVRLMDSAQPLDSSLSRLCVSCLIPEAGRKVPRNRCHHIPGLLAFYVLGRWVAPSLRPVLTEHCTPGLLFSCSLGLGICPLPLGRKYCSRELERLISDLSTLLQLDECIANAGRNIYLTTVGSVNYTSWTFQSPSFQDGATAWRFRYLRRSRDCSAHKYVQCVHRWEPRTHKTTPVKSHFVHSNCVCVYLLWLLFRLYSEILFIGFLSKKKNSLSTDNVSIFCIYVLLICKYLDFLKLLCSLKKKFNTRLVVKMVYNVVLWYQFPRCSLCPFQKNTINYFNRTCLCSVPVCQSCVYGVSAND